MKTLLNKKNENGENGIAIMFTMIMMSIFFLIGFGFISMASNNKTSSTLRQVSQTLSSSASDSLVNQAIACMEQRLFNEGKEYADASLFVPLAFKNTTTSVDLAVWGTKSADQAGIADALSLQIAPSAGSSEEFKMDTADPNFATYSFGWRNSITEAWMVIESNGLDPNYLGGKAGGAVTSIRAGKYTRELDMNLIETAANVTTIYRDWDLISTGPPTPWENKKSLVSSLAADFETAVELYQIGITPIQLKDISTYYDLTTINNTTSLDDILNGIQWLKNGDNDKLKTQIAANIKDYIDDDTECTEDSTTGVYGVERTPQINEVSVQVQNLTTEPPTDSMGNYTDPSDTSVAIKAQVEFINLLNVSGWGGGDGTNCQVSIEFKIEAKRGSSTAINTTHTIVIQNIDLSSFTGYEASPALNTFAADPLTGNALKESAELVDLKITINKVTLEKVPGKIWDVATVGIASSNYSVEEGKYVRCAFQVDDARVNDIGWDTGEWADTDGTSDILKTFETKNTNCAISSWDEAETGANQPWELSTAFMPEKGGITSLDELGLISRGEIGKTLNLVDYNIKTPGKIDEYKPTTTNFTLDPDDFNKFDGGDRAILDYVRINAGNSYKQFSAINPNTTNQKALSFMMNGVKTAKSDTIPIAEIEKVVSRFPGIERLENDKIFYLAHFHDTDNANNQNRNPKTYGYPFSKYTLSYGTTNDDLTDAAREALLVKTMYFVSPKYSYFTILTASTQSGTTTSYYNFVRRDNESKTYKILTQIKK